MAHRRPRERSVYLPWERRTGLIAGLPLGRARAALLVAFLLLGAWFIFSRQRSKSDLRATRATLIATRRAIELFRADHPGVCPAPDLSDLVAKGYMSRPPRDAWNMPLRFVCPSTRPDRAFDLSSGGPDGEPGGLDRVE